MALSAIHVQPRKLLKSIITGVSAVLYRTDPGVSTIEAYSLITELICLLGPWHVDRFCSKWQSVNPGSFPVPGLQTVRKHNTAGLNVALLPSRAWEMSSSGNERLHPAIKGEEWNHMYSFPFAHLIICDVITFCAIFICTIWIYMANACVVKCSDYYVYYYNMEREHV